MASSFSGFVLDPSKCSQLSMEEKRELVYEISKWSEGAPEMLQSWSRRELLEILCTEMGKERKYTGLTKYKIIELLLKIVSEKSAKTSDGADSRPNPPPLNSQSSSKRRRKMDNPSQVTNATTEPPGSDGDGIPDNVIFCGNAACRASVRPQDAFCKRCSCCICHKYDDNKDPSVWLICDSEPPNEGDSCGISCHVECALKDERAGILKDEKSTRLDGSFCCVSCGKVNDLLGCWRKQIVTAKDARRVDILCYRISLSHRLLRGTIKYQELHEIVDTIAEKLEAEVGGSLDRLPINMARGIVNRLSCGAEIQKLCASAVRMLDALAFKDTQPSTACNVLDSSSVPSTVIRFEDTSPTSLSLVLSSSSPTENVVGYTMWHKKADCADYPKEPMATVFQPITRFLISDLSPATEYVFKIHSLGDSGEISKCEARFMTTRSIDDIRKTLATKAGSSEPECESPRANCSGLSNPSSEVDESNSKPSGDLSDSPGSYSGNCKKSRNPDPNMGKLTGCTYKEQGESQDSDVPVLHKKESIVQEEMPGDSISALDEEHVTGDAGSEPTLTIQAGSQRDSTNSSEDNLGSIVPKLDHDHHSKVPLVEDISTGNESNTPITEVVPFRSFDSPLPITPHKPEMTGRTKPIISDPKNRPVRPEDPQAGSSSKKRTFGRCEEMCDEDGSTEGDYAYSVKVIRWLECEGHVEKNFRVKFLTWFSLWATPPERKIVRVYIDTLIDDPPSLAGQLVDTFSEGIYRKRPSVPTGFCMKLWH